MRLRSKPSNGVVEERRTLMSKLREHYYNRKFSPEPEKADLWGSLFFWGFLSLLCFIQWWYLIPLFHEETPFISFWLRTFTCFLYFETVLNWILSARKKCSHVTTERIQRALPEYNGHVPDGWRMCFKCQIPVPPRSHHCKICNACILKHDHHCFFTGACVGFWNQRHFIVWVFYVACMGCFTIPYIVSYLNSEVHILIYEYCLPVTFFKWCMGTFSSFTLLLVIELYLSLICEVASLGFFLWEVLIVLRGQTSYEFLHMDETYRTSMFTGLRNVYGPMWPINFIWPLPVAQDGNGFMWVAQKDHKRS